MSAMVSQITSLTIVYSIVYSGSDQRKPAIMCANMVFILYHIEGQITVRFQLEYSNAFVLKKNALNQ